MTSVELTTELNSVEITNQNNTVVLIETPNTVEIINENTSFEVKNTNLDYVIGKNSGKLSLAGYVRLANLVKNTLGIELIEGDFKDPSKRGFATGMVFNDIANVFDNAPGKENNALRFRLKQANIKSFSEFWDRTFNTNLVSKIKQAVKEGTYNDNEPFRNSMTAMDLLSRMFQEWHHFGHKRINICIKDFFYCFIV